jgi:hypothetical protein
VRLGRAIDLWMGELARAGRALSTRASYERYLFKFISQLERSRPDVRAREVTTTIAGISSTAGTGSRLRLSAPFTARSTVCSAGFIGKVRSTQTR